MHALPFALLAHPTVRDVRLVGSRADGRAHARSDWDFAVEVDDFAIVARDLAVLFEPFRPLAGQWDRYSTHACYMLIFRGPTKVDFFFPQEPREWSPPWEPGPDTLGAIDRHFWDWILWLDQKRHGGQPIAEDGLGVMWERMLAPLGVESVPGSVPDAVSAYLAARDRLERSFGLHVPRALQDEVLPVVVMFSRPETR